MRDLGISNFIVTLKLSNNLLLSHSVKTGNARKLTLFLASLSHSAGDKVVVRCDVNAFDHLVCWKLPV